MLPRSTQRFLCFFLFAGCLVTLAEAIPMSAETIPLTLRQMDADAAAPVALRRAETAKNRLTPWAVLALAAGTVAVLCSGRKKQRPAAKPPSSAAAEAVTLRP